MRFEEFTLDNWLEAIVGENSSCNLSDPDTYEEQVQHFLASVKTSAKPAEIPIEYLEAG